MSSYGDCIHGNWVEYFIFRVHVTSNHFSQQTEDDVDIEDLLGVSEGKSEMFEAESSKSLEKSILEKINTN